MSDARRGGYRLLVFDWDGTIYDSIGCIVACTHATLSELRLPAVDESRIRDAIGLGLRETVERFSPGCDDETFRSVVEVYRRHWFGTWADRALLLPGAAAALKSLAASGYWLAVATAKGRKGLDRELERADLEGLFLATRTLDEAPSKPHPGMILGILDELGARPGETLMIGDSVHDLEMAGNAGVAALGVATGTQPCATLLASGAIDCLESVADLPAWLADPPR